MENVNMLDNVKNIDDDNLLKSFNLKNGPLHISGKYVILTEEEYEELERRNQMLKLIEEIEAGEDDYKNGRVMMLQEFKKSF